MIIAGIAGFIVSAIASEFYASLTQNDLLSSLATVLTGFGVSTFIFVILFLIEYRMMYVDSSTGRIDSVILRILFKKSGAAWWGGIINNVSRIVILYYLFSIDFDPSDASILSSLTASGVSYVSINLVLRRFGVFRIGNTSKDLFRDPSEYDQRYIKSISAYRITGEQFQITYH
jgi:hypothetical protein